MKKFLMSIYFVNLTIIIFFWLFTSWGLFTNPSVTPIKSFMDLGGIFLAIARLCGLSAMAFVLFQLILIGRTKWLEGRYGFDSLAKMHKENGRIAAVFLIMHPIFIFFAYNLISRVNFTYPSFLSKPFVFLAPIAFTLLLTNVILSNPFISNRFSYNYWYYFHLFNYIAISLVLWHQFLSGGDFQQNPTFFYYWLALYMFVAISFIYFRFINPLYLYYKHKFRVEKIVEETHDTISIYITGQRMKSFKFKPGQFLALWFLNKKLLKEHHPFSISAIFNEKDIRITIKLSGDFTKKLEHLGSGSKVFIEGPLGKFTPDSCKKDKVLFVAAGVGITPIRPLMEQFANEGKNLILILGNKTKKDVIFREELTSLSSKYQIPIHYFFSREQDVENSQYLGRITIQEILKLVEDLSERDIFICAPPPMMKNLNKDLLKTGIKEDYIHFEKFNW